ncbi:hypothetical protein MBLNU230_g5843t1 [Neophaeotheca triangularis]
MQVQTLMLYPIKSLRATCPPRATITKHGFTHDRRFMLLQVQRDSPDSPPSYKNMHVAYYPKMVLFFPTISIPSSDGNASRGIIDIAYRPLGEEETTYPIDLEPNVRGLEVIDVIMHGSGTKAHVMPANVNDWFSQCFGYEVVLAYLGDNTREVLMSTRRQETQANAGSGGWLSSIVSKTTGYLSSDTAEESSPTITFADCAPFLIASEKSMHALHTRLPEGEEFDISKFRPNIIVSGADEAWEEDFWGSLRIKASNSGDGGVLLYCEQNCNRCQSINIDYDTGKPGEGEAGKMLKKMMSDRRVDKGAKWSPVFGRYAFVAEGSEGLEVRVGDEVGVEGWNRERTRFGEYFQYPVLAGFG